MPTPKKQIPPASKKVPQVQPPATEAKPSVTREPNELQLLVANLASELIMNGGRRTDVESLLYGCLGHSLSMRFGDDSSWLEKAIGRDIDDWYNRLSRQWPEVSEPRDPAPKTVSDQVRASLRDDIRYRLEEFMAEAPMHELYLMREVLRSYDNISPDSERAECTLAAEFMYEIDSDHTYVKVPREHIKLIEQYARLLNGENCGKAA